MGCASGAVCLTPNRKERRSERCMNLEAPWPSLRPTSSFQRELYAITIPKLLRRPLVPFTVLALAPMIVASSVMLDLSSALSAAVGRVEGSLVGEALRRRSDSRSRVDWRSRVDMPLEAFPRYWPRRWSRRWPGGPREVSHAIKLAARGGAPTSWRGTAAGPPCPTGSRFDAVRWTSMSRSSCDDEGDI